MHLKMFAKVFVPFLGKSTSARSVQYRCAIHPRVDVYLIHRALLGHPKMPHLGCSHPVGLNNSNILSGFENFSTGKEAIIDNDGGSMAKVTSGPNSLDYGSPELGGMLAIACV